MLHTTNETARLAALREYGVVSPLADPDIDRIVKLAVSLFQMPLAAVALIDDQRELFAARVGLTPSEIPRQRSFCAHALGSRRIMEIPDALLDARFADNAAVTGEPFIRFYAGAPLVSPNGYVLGTLCIGDHQPHPPLTDAQRDHLQALARLVMNELELRRLELAVQASLPRLEQMAQASPDAIICFDERQRLTLWNPAAQRLLGYAGEEAIGQTLDALLPPDAIEKLRALTSADCGGTEEIDMRHASGVAVPVEVSVSAWRERGRVRFCAVMRDATERRHNEAWLYRLAHIDALTELPNRTLLLMRMEAELAARNAGGFMLIDFDGFKAVNDSLGHAAGDQMLAVLARRLQQSLGPYDTVARLGGDEFAVLMPDLDDPARAARSADDLIASISQPVTLEGEPVAVSASVGIVFYPRDASTVRELLLCADLAMYEAKHRGKQRHCVFSPPLRAAALERRPLGTESLLQTAETVRRQTRQLREKLAAQGQEEEANAGEKLSADAEALYQRLAARLELEPRKEQRRGKARR